MKVKLVLVLLCFLSLLVSGANAHRIYDTNPDNSTFDYEPTISIPCPEGQYRSNRGECIDEDSVLIYDD